VIGANTSSLPEVIGLQDALFDPLDVDSICTKILEALTDDAFRNRLREHGGQQAKRFRWDDTAKRAWVAWQGLTIEDLKIPAIATSPTSQLIEALVPFLPSTDDQALVEASYCIAQNCSSGTERQLLVDVSELCQRDSATGVQRVVRSYLFHLLNNPPMGFRVLPVYATQTEGYRYATAFAARLLNQLVPEKIDHAICWQRGDLFFGLDMQHHVQLAQAEFYAQIRQDGVVVKFLVYDLLPIQLAQHFSDGQAKQLHEQWLKMIALQDQAICISKATADAYESWLAKHEIVVNKSFSTNWVHMGADLEGSKPSTGLPVDATEILLILRSSPTFLVVSTLEPRKAQLQILDAVEELWAQGRDINLVFVGQQGWKTDSFVGRLANHSENGKRLFWLKGISDEYLDLVYKSSTCLVAASINEGFGLPLIEAAKHGVPIIARDTPVFREVAGLSAHYFSGDNGNQLAKALAEWLELYRFGAAPSSKGIKWSTWQQATESIKSILIERKYPRRQLLVDISELVQRDAKTGIQRVVRNILREWIENPPAGLWMLPVYAEMNGSYNYARKFVANFSGLPSSELIDEPVDYAPGDVFFALDFQPQVQTTQAEFYQRLRQQGVIVKFMVYDLLCIKMPEYFSSGADRGFLDWLKVVGDSDGAVCISTSVADEMAIWLKQTHQARKRRYFEITVNFLGADINDSNSTLAPSDSENVQLNKIKETNAFLMVGTLEPRKGHTQVLDAFERLWNTNADVSLVIVGKRGWMIDKLIARLDSHREFNNRLFWLEGISDSHLEQVYATSTCLIAASFGEGFGLPLIEAAQHKLPIVARDIPVFREVAGEHAYYFNSYQPDELAQAIESWFALYKTDQHPKSDNMPWVTWKESAQQLGGVILHQK
jgi:glycosyltransferase involved in cell wall biosynthesis